jgi:transcriptional regulator with XRE-family HTH domain
MSRERRTTPRNLELAALGWAIETLIARGPSTTQAAVAASCDLDNKQVSSYVRGQVDLSYHNLLQLCDGLHAKPVELMALAEEFKERALRRERELDAVG